MVGFLRMSKLSNFLITYCHFWDLRPMNQSCCNRKISNFLFSVLENIVIQKFSVETANV